MTPRSALRAWLVTGSLAGAADLAAACLHAGAHGASPVRVAHSIASGLLGQAAFEGGLATAALGVVLHFVIALGATGTYLLASRRLSWLTQRPLAMGPLFGLAVYWFMQLVVLPLSAVTLRPPSLSTRLIGMGIHVACVGLPIALGVARLAPSASPARR